MRRMQRRLRNFTAHMLDLPKDLVFDLPRITMIGDMQMYVENHRGVLQFSAELLRLRLSVGELQVKGQGLMIRAILPEEVFVEGTIQHIEYIHSS